MRKRFLALLLAACIACTMLVVPASASSANTAVQTAVILGGLTADQTAGLNAQLTRGQLARLLVAFSPYRESAGAQGAAGSIFTDVSGSDPLAPYIRIAAAQGWMSGYTDGSFRPGSPVTLEEACSAVLKLLGYDVTTLSGTFPTAQLNKASELGLRDGLTCAPGQGMNLEDGAVLLYNALTALNGEGQNYGTSLGFTAEGGEVALSSIVMGSLEGPFVAGENTQLPFEPATIYRNDTAVTTTGLQPYDVYYYSQNARTLWVYSRKAAGRITAVTPSASAPATVTVAGTEYTLGTAAAAAQISSLNGGGVGQVVTLLLGMDNQVVQVLTGQQAEQVFYGVVQNSARSLIEEDGADVMQSVTVACTDGVARTVHVDKSLNFPAGWLVEITVDENGEQVESIDARSLSGTFNAEGTTLGDTPLAEDVEILDTTSEGVAGAVSPSRLAGVNLRSGDVRYYTTNAAGQIDRLILDDVTGDLWTYGVLDDVRNLANVAGSAIDDALKDGQSTTLPDTGSLTTQTGNQVVGINLPSTSDILYGIIDGSIAGTLWQSLSSSTGSMASYALQLLSRNTTGTISDIFGFLGSGASYVCYVNGEAATLNTAVKYPVVAGGVAVSRSTNGTVKNMVQLMPVMIDRLGPASVMSGSTRYDIADDMQVYLWYRGQYYPTSLSQVDPEGYHLIGWYDNMGCTAGSKVRVLVAVKKD